MSSRRRALLAGNGTVPPTGLIYHFPLTENGNDVVGGITPTATGAAVTFSGMGAKFARAANNYIRFSGRIDMSNIVIVTVELFPLTSFQGMFCAFLANAGSWFANMQVWGVILGAGVFNGSASNVVIDGTSSGLSVALNTWNQVELIFMPYYQRISNNGNYKEYAASLYPGGMTTVFCIGSNTDGTPLRCFDGYIRNLKLWAV